MTAPTSWRAPRSGPELAGGHLRLDGRARLPLGELERQQLPSSSPETPAGCDGPHLHGRARAQLVEDHSIERRSCRCAAFAIIEEGLELARGGIHATQSDELLRVREVGLPGKDDHRRSACRDHSPPRLADALGDGEAG